MVGARKEKRLKCLHGIQSPGIAVALHEKEWLGGTDWRGKINSFVDMVNI